MRWRLQKLVPRSQHRCLSVTNRTFTRGWGCHCVVFPHFFNVSCFPVFTVSFFWFTSIQFLSIDNIFCLLFNLSFILHCIALSIFGAFFHFSSLLFFILFAIFFFHYSFPILQFSCCFPQWFFRYSLSSYYCVSLFSFHVSNLSNVPVHCVWIWFRLSMFSLCIECFVHLSLFLFFMEFECNDDVHFFQFVLVFFLISLTLPFCFECTFPISLGFCLLFSIALAIFLSFSLVHFACFLLYWGFP